MAPMLGKPIVVHLALDRLPIVHAVMLRTVWASGAIETKNCVAAVKITLIAIPASTSLLVEPALPTIPTE